MREIKFRAWNKKNQRMSYWGNDFDYITRRHTGEIELIYANAGGDPQTYIDDFELMQFTGLLDKNGKEIYEHDLLYFKGQKVFCFYDDTRAIFSWAMVSEYDLWKLGHSPVGVFGIDELSRENNDELEVIGNIYENPELLK